MPKWTKGWPLAILLLISAFCTYHNLLQVASSRAVAEQRLPLASNGNICYLSWHFFSSAIFLCAQL
jgi:hypothetical protein